MLKKCHKCGIEKSVNLFDKSSENKDGLSHKCKLCESIRQADKFKRKKEMITARNQRWKDLNRDKIKKYNKSHYDKNLIGYTARNILNRAIARGDVISGDTCERCGGRSEHGHHEDYSKPLEVMWLCRSCHKRIHALMKEELK